LQKNNNISSLFDRSGNLSLEAMQRYLEGDLGPEELSVVEKHLADSPFDREALEGLEKFRTVQVARDVKELNEKIGKKASSGKERQLKASRRFSRYYWVAAAAVIGILVVSAIIVLMYRYSPEPLQLAVKQQDTVIEEADNKGTYQQIPEESTDIPGSGEPEIVTPAEDIAASDRSGKSPMETEEEPPVTEQKITITGIEADEDVAAENNRPVPIGGIAGRGKENPAASGGDASARASYTIQAEDLMKQGSDIVEQEKQVFMVVEQMPEYPGGEEALINYLSENLQYPEGAKESGVQGQVFVTFVVEKDGSISEVEVLRGLGGGCDEEAVRVVEEMPKWKPGAQRGQPVRVQYNLPIKFSLD
jgi:protein TonB